MDQSTFDGYKESNHADKIARLAKEAPMLPIGLTAVCAIVGHGIYKFRTKKIKTSLFLINYRVIAHSTFVGCLTVGLIYMMIDEHILKKRVRHNKEIQDRTE